MAKDSKAKDKPGKKGSKKEEVDEDFQYIVRMANSDLKGERPVVYALTAIPGVGLRVADIMVKMSGVPRNEKIGSLKDDQIDALKNVLEKFQEDAPEWILNRQNDWETGANLHLYGNEVQLTLRDDINRMKKIRCYKGIRHETGHKVRGQKTKSNGRTGLTLGVSRQKAK